MKSVIKNKKQKVKKPVVSEKIKRIFIPKGKEPMQITAIKIVNNMSTYSSYPAGKSIDKISKIIIKEKKLSIGERLELLLDAYGKYYKYQHQATVSYAIDEEANEFSRLQNTYNRMGKTISFNDYYNSRMKEQEYIVNREFRDNTKKLLTSTDDLKNVEDILRNIGSCGIRVINKALKLQDDFWTSRDNDGYKISDDEKLIKDTLMYRYEQKLETNKSQINQNSTKQISEIEPRPSDPVQNI